MSQLLTAQERLNTITWGEIFNYSTESPTFLTWKHKRLSKGGGFVNRANNGIAGGITNGNLLSIHYEKNGYSIPKIIWVIHNGCIPDNYSVYFKDSNTLNASIENLYLKETNPEAIEKYSEDLKKYLKYDPTSPSGLRWIAKFSKSSTIKVGDVAGSLDDSDGYWKLHALGNNYKIHRIVWFLFNGKIPKTLWVDHMNGIRNDNRIENLRIVLPSVNCRNRTKNKNNITGYNNISYYEGYNKNGTFISRYSVRVGVNRKSKTFGFSCLKYGRELALELAIKKHEQLVKEANEQGAGFTERHGT